MPATEQLLLLRTVAALRRDGRNAFSSSSSPPLQISLTSSGHDFFFSSSTCAWSSVRSRETSSFTPARSCVRSGQRCVEQTRAVRHRTGKRQPNTLQPNRMVQKQALLTMPTRSEPSVGLAASTATAAPIIAQQLLKFLLLRTEGRRVLGFVRYVRGSSRECGQLLC